MSLISTRGGDAATASQAILRGLARDSGLFVPCEFPRLSLRDIADMSRMTYAERACKVLGALLDDYTDDEIAGAVCEAYGDGFDAQGVAPLEGGALAGGVDAVALAGVEEQLAGVEEVVLAEERALGAARAFDGGGDAAVAGGEPRDDVRGLGPRAYLEGDGLCLNGHAGARRLPRAMPWA